MLYWVLFSRWWKVFWVIENWWVLFLVIVICGKLLVGNVCRLKWFLLVCMVRCLFLSIRLIFVLLGSECRIFCSLCVLIVMVLLLLLVVILVEVVIWILILVVNSVSLLFFFFSSMLERMGKVWWCLIIFDIDCKGVRSVFFWFLIRIIN